ncbi:hypothetical protein HHI36_012719 [Cryptolaemus montrouzieri]|uniref:Acyltransferase n=1 Tax=Cryptolaemus montrouzieri TaxID=559131 RepID=A0ABD2NFX6_9CUCU
MMAYLNDVLHAQIDRSFEVLGVIGLLIIQVASIFVTPILAYFFIFHTRFWWLCILYICWYLFLDNEIHERGGRRIEWVRKWSWWTYLSKYFPVKAVRTSNEKLDPKRNYLFCYFPHGVLSTGAFCTLGTNAGGFPELFPDHKTYLHTLSLFFKLPFIRELALWLGGLSASGRSLSHVLSRPEGGNISGLVVGGAVEAFYCKPGLHKIVYKKRKGFIKIAIKKGSPLVPVYCFGETDLYTLSNFSGSAYFNKFRDLVKRVMGFVIIFPKSREFLGILPNRHPLTVVVGDPIDVQKIENPTQEQIDELHQKFEKKLIELFDDQKKNYLENFEEAHLEII